MFDIGFWEIVLISVIGLIVLGPERLPVAIRTVMSWVRAVKGTANSMKNELSQELKIHEMHESLRKAEQQGLEGLSPELNESVESLKQAAQAVTRPYSDDAKPTTESPSPSASTDSVPSPSPKAPTASVASQEKK